MQYFFPIITPANTDETDPVRVATPLNVGKLVKVGIYFPWGCAGLVRVRILHYEHQLYPTNPDEWLAGNEIFIEFECAYDISQGYTEFKVEAYNEDDFYSHTPFVNFVVLPVTGLYIPESSWVEG